MTGVGAQAIRNLYIHVPFCERKCPYCAFYSEVTSPVVQARYVRALIRELDLIAADLDAVTVYIGGGTPSLLAHELWSELLAALDRAGVRGAEEWTIECNPASVTEQTARLWRQAGVNRVSLGVQSLDPVLLRTLGRIHSRADVFAAYDLVRRAGFDNVNLDLIFGIPGQTGRQWRQTLREALTLGSEHLSAYELTYEEDTPFFRARHEGRKRSEEDLACAMYQDLLEACDRGGLVQYEVSNFARPTRGAPGDPATRACRHNVNTWRGGGYFGLGPSACGYVRGERTRNVPDVRAYCEALERGQRPVVQRETLSSQARAGEIAAFGLRLTDGWSFDEFRLVTGHDLRAGWESEIRQLTECGWGMRDDDSFRLTRLGLRFADSAAALFLR